MQIKIFSIKGNAFTAAFCFWILWFTFLEPVYAQPGRTTRFERISIEQGLSQNTINCILQDRQGFLWFGTQGGLNKYDGYKFTIYQHNPDDGDSLSNNFILSILEGSKGALWIGTRGGGLDKFDKKTGIFTHYQNQVDNPKSLGNDTVNSIFEDSLGNLWVGTDGGGLNNFNQKAGTFTHYLTQANNPKSISHDTITSVYEDSSGTLWVGTGGGGLNSFDRKAGTFTRYLTKADNPKSISHDHISSILEDSLGNLWIGTSDGGLNKFSQKEKIFTRYLQNDDNPKSISHNSIASIIEDSRGNLWIATDNGLNRFDRKEETFTHYTNQANDPYSISANVVDSILEDAGGTLWIGATGQGINKLDLKTVAFASYRKQADNPNSLSNNYVFSFCEDSSGNLWIGTYGGGLNKLNRKTEMFTHYINQPDNPKSLSHNIVGSIVEDKDGDLWIGTGGGLNKFDRKTETFTRYVSHADDPKSLSSNSVFSIIEDRGGAIWVGTSDGLNKLNRDMGTFNRYLHQADNPKSLSHNTVYSMFEDSSGSLWIGTTGGLNKFSQKEDSFTRYLHDDNNPKSISHDALNCIIEDSHGNLWIGTDGGLNKFDRKKETFTYYTEKDGLPDDVVYGIIEDDNRNLWLSTNNGISKFNPVAKTFTNYDVKDGLQSNEFNSWAYYKDQAGNMYFGGISGYNVFHPKNIQDNTYVPPVVITDFLLFNKPVDVARPGIKSEEYQLKQHISHTKDITLDYTDYIFAFEFSVLNYRQSEKNQFAYKLEGFDRDWVEADYMHRRATYTDLSHGEYTFKAKGSNDDGYWNKEGASIKLTILPPPWLTWWAYSLYTLAVLALIFWFIQSQRKKVIRKQRELDREKQVSARLRQFDKLKNEFLANTSHELRTPLNGIIGIAESLIDGMEEWSSEKIRSNLTMIASSGKRLSSLVNDVLDFSKMQHRSLELSTNPVDLYAISDVVLTTSKTLLGDKDLKLVNDIDDNIPTVDADENRLQQIMYNIIGNAIKFTETGSVTVSAKAIEHQMEVSVADTGTGIPKEKIARVFESFEQAEGSTARVYGGTGLGLAVTKQLVELHGGEIRVESTEGTGSTFSFTLPVSGEKASKLKADEQPVSKVQLLEPISTDPMEDIPKIEDVSPADGDFNILIVDDDPVNLQVLENHLSLQNYNITQAPNGPEALKLIEGDQQFDLILLDIMMPKMSGYEVTEMLRNSHAAHELPIIFLSAKNQVIDLITGFAAGGNDYLTKPISKAELLSRVKTHLQLLDINRNLEQKVRDRTAEVLRQKEEIEKQAKQLAEANLELEKLSIVASEVDNSVTIMDAEGNIEWVNQAFERFYRMTLDEYTEEKGRNIKDASSNTKIETAIDECISQNNPVSYESYIKMKKGENMWAHTTLTPMIDKDGNLLKIIAIDSDISELKKAEQKAITHAHKAGMADVAVTTIHNVGNILNSVKTSVGISSNMIKKSTLKNFEMANGLLRENMDKLEDFICNDPKGKKLMKFYLGIEDKLVKERTELGQTIDRIENRIEIIASVIDAQRGYTKDVEFLVEEVDLVEMVEDAITMNLDFIEQNSIKIEKEMADIRPMPIQKLKMIQILMNLITNAKDAMKKTPNDTRRIKFLLNEQGESVQLKVIDTGSGINPENIKSIFNHGFTTKRDHQGFGLHSCANHMTEMGGRLWAESKGEGQGATFVLEFQDKQEQGKA